ncbi:MAG: hypothetical protein WAL80_08795 [Xanthobacteraceae bacterium]|jgi:hypothetical protein
MDTTQLPYFLRVVQSLGPTTVAIVVGSIAAYIAWRQWRTANYRLRLDMFDRRYSVFKATRLLIDKIAINGQVSSPDFVEFRNDISGAEFFFDGEMRQFFTRLNELSWRAYLARSRQGRTKDDVALDKLFKEEDQCLELLEAEKPRLEKIFARYLDLSEIGL